MSAWHWFQSLSFAHAAMALLAAFVLADALYIAAVEWRRTLIRRRQQRCLRVNRDYKRSIRSSDPDPLARRNSVEAVTR